VRKKFLSCITIFSAVLLASPVRAEELSARQALQRASDCLISNREAEALRIFSTPYAANEFGTVNRPLLDAVPECSQFSRALVGDIRISNMSPNDFDAMIAGALVRYFYSAKDPGDLGKAPFGKFAGLPTVEAKSLPHSDEDRQTFLKERVLAAGSFFRDLLAQCVVRSNSHGSRALLLSMADSRDEEAAIERLNPDIGNCMPGRMGIGVNTARLRDRMSIYYLKFATSLESSQ
jgi:hypothetical protein